MRNLWVRMKKKLLTPLMRRHSIPSSALTHKPAAKATSQALAWRREHLSNNVLNYYSLKQQQPIRQFFSLGLQNMLPQAWVFENRTSFAEAIPPLKSNLRQFHLQAVNFNIKKDLDVNQIENPKQQFNPQHSLFKLKQAKEKLEHSLKIKETQHGKYHPQIADILNDLGTVYGDLGDYKQQKEVYERALKILGTHYNKELVKVAIILRNLGTTYGALGDSKQQKELLERALKTLEAYYGKEHVEAALTLTSLGVAYGDLGDYKQQKELLERALKILETHYGKEHVAVAQTLMNLGTAYGDLGDAKLSKELLERALKIKEAHYGKEHVEVALALTNLSTAYGSLGDYKQQKELLERALKIKEAHYGKEHVEVALTLTNLGTAYGSLGDSKQQKEFHERSLKILETHYGKDHVEVANVLNNLGYYIMVFKGDVKHAKELLERALTIKEHHYGKDHVETALPVANLGNAYNLLGNVKAAKELLERALSIYDNHYSKEHQIINIGIILYDLAIIYDSLNDTENAFHSAARCYAIYHKIFGKHHDKIKEAKELFEKCEKTLTAKPSNDSSNTSQSAVGSDTNSQNVITNTNTAVLFSQNLTATSTENPSNTNQGKSAGVRP
jgi:tetratricopeptide (TPR) repeat protein